MPGAPSSWPRKRLRGHYEDQFLERLAEARSNIKEYGTGADIYRRWVTPAIVNLLGVAAHYAISSMFDGYQAESSIYCYDVNLRDRRQGESGRARLSMGQANIRSRITLESEEVSFGVVHFGDHNLNAGVRGFQDEEAYQKMVNDITTCFESADLPGTVRQLDRYFEGVAYSLKSLFRDEQRRVLDEITMSALEEAGGSYRHIYELYGPLMRFLSDAHLPMPKVLRLTAEFVINSSLRREFEGDEINFERIRGLLDAASHDNIALDAAGLSFALKRRLAERVNHFLQSAESLDELKAITA